MSRTIKILTASDAYAFFELRRQLLVETPLAFPSSPEDDIASTIADTHTLLARSSECVVIGAFDDDLAGIAGLLRDRHDKCRHKVMIWGMYVAPSHRGQGVGAELLEAALEHARSMPGVEWVYLTVSSAAPGARRLYERAGFELWGTEPEAFRHDGESVVDYHMARRLD